MKYLSVCSGIEAATCAWHPLGWEPVAFSDIEPFPSAVLAHHYPDVPNLGDMTKFKEWPNYANVDVLVGGTPCQSFSVAGLRKGLDDPRGNLMLTYLSIAAKYNPTWLVWENVPGVLSSNKGRDFGTFLGALGEIGYGFAYRVLDAQYFGVAQRRRRVFVVGHLGDWRRAAAVLFERESLSGNPAPRREKREVSATIPSRSTGGGGLGTDLDCDGGLIGCRMSAFGQYEQDETASSMKARDYKDATDLVVHGTQDPCTSDKAFALDRNNGQEPIVCFEPGILKREGGDSRVNAEVCSTLRSQMGDNQPAVAFNGDQSAKTRSMGEAEECTPTLRADGPCHVQKSMSVRRLTPVECERLQGFPDNYTQIPWRNKPADQCPDGPRYKALGNSMAVPVMNWIGRRIEMVKKC